MELLHEFLPATIHQTAALAAHRLGNQEAAVRRQQRGRVELDVLHVDATGAGAVGHRDAVAARARRIRRVQKNAAQTARGENGLLGQQRENSLRRPIEYVCPDAGQQTINVRGFERVMRGGQQVHRSRVGDRLHVRVRANPLQERPLNRGTGLILVVNDARQRVPRLARQVKVCGILRRYIEGNAQLVNQNFLHQAWTFAAQQPGGVGRTEAAADREDIGNQLFRGFPWRAIDDSALRAIGIALRGVRGARQQSNLVAPLSGFPGGRQSTQAAADDEHVGL